MQFSRCSEACTVSGTAATKDDEDDDFDLFGSDGEDDVSIIM